MPGAGTVAGYKRVKVTLAAAGYVILALLLAWSGGALDGSWAAEPDEAAHFLNGVMVGDYVRSGFAEHPLRYAERYYEHYPKIGLGHWPPLFSMVEAAWFTIVPAGYAMGLVLVNLLAAGVAVQIWWLGRRWFAGWLAVAAGWVWLLLPMVRQYSQMFMAEMLLVFCVTAALMAFARQRAGFGFWFGMALLTKGTGIALAMLPGAAIAMGGRWEWLRQRWLWLSAGIVLGLAAGWYWKVPGARHERVAAYGGLTVLPGRSIETLEALEKNLGPLLGVLALAGVVLAWRRRNDPYWLAVLAFLPGNFLLRMVVGAWETRHLVIVLPEVLLLSALGVDWLQRAAGPWWRRGILLAVVAAGTGWHLMGSWPQRVEIGGVAEVVAELRDSKRILAAGRAPVEGAVIAAVALTDKRPGRTVRRGSKILWESDFLGWSQRSLVVSQEGVAAVLGSEGIDAVVLDRHEEQRAVGVVRKYVSEAREWEERGVFGGRMEVWVRR